MLAPNPNKDVKGFSFSTSGGFRPALFRCEDAEVSLSLCLFYTVIRYVQNRPTRFSRERLIHISLIHLTLGILENHNANTTAFLRQELVAQANPAFKWVKEAFQFSVLVIIFICSLLL